MIRKEYLRPAAQVMSLVNQSLVLQGSQTIPVDPGTEGNQEEAEVKGGSFDSGWDDIW